MATDPDLISTSEAARILGRPVATVNRWATEGRLAVALKLPGETGARLYRRVDVEALATPSREAS